MKIETIVANLWVTLHYSDNHNVTKEKETRNTLCISGFGFYYEIVTIFFKNKGR